MTRALAKLLEEDYTPPIVLRRFVSLSALILAILGSTLHAQQAPPLAKDRDFQNGLEALRDELPDRAVTRFEEALKNRKEDDPARLEIQLRLIEALVRSRQFEKALPLFDLPSLAENETALFWKAHYRNALGHFFESATLFEQLHDAKDPTLRRLARLSRARILASLGEPREALPILKGLAEDQDASTATEAKLLQASLHLHTGDFETTADLLADTESTLPSFQRQKQYLEAHLALGQQDWANAFGIFRTLTDNPYPEKLPQHLYLGVDLPGYLFHGAILGRADALVGLDRKDEAVGLLLAFLNEYPDIGNLEPFFTRLAPWAGESDTLQDLLQARLLVWSNASAPSGDPVLRSLHDPVATALAGEPGATPSSLSTFALYHRALHLAYKNEAESVRTARFLLARLRLENPNHPLALASLLETARLHLGSKHPDAALAALAALEDLAGPGQLKADAADLAARIRVAEGDWAESAEAFARARKSFQDDDDTSYTINQGLGLLMSGNGTEFAELLASLGEQEMITALKLERALLAATNRDSEARELLDTFLRNHPDHRRTAEARLAVAGLSVHTEPLDLSMALAQLDSVDPSLYPDEIALRHLLTRLRLSELTGQWEDAIAEAAVYLQRDPPLEDAVLLKLGEAFYLNKNYNQARIQFLQVANRESAGAHHEVALFFAAKSALRVGTDNARADGLKLLQEVASKDGPLAAEARLQLGRAYIDVAELDKALAELAPLLDSKAPASSRTDALLLAAEAHRDHSEPDHLAKALEIYRDVLADAELPYALSNRIHFLQGLAYERLKTEKALGLAVDSYLRVVNQENKPKGTPITEWKYFYDCGFNLIDLLEDGHHWRAAHRVAVKLRDAGGYRSEDARKRAKDLQLEHQIWDNEPVDPEGN